MTLLSPGTYTMRLIEVRQPEPHKTIKRVPVKFLCGEDTHQTWVFIASAETAWLVYHGLCALEGTLWAVEVEVKPVIGTHAYYNKIKVDWKFGTVHSASDVAPQKAVAS